MSSVIMERELACPAERAWALLRAVGDAHKAFPGVLTDSRLEDGARVVTFANGMVARERIVTIDPARRRVAYAVVGERFEQHAAAMEIVALGGSCRFVWVSDFLPDALEPMVRGLMAQGVAAFAGAAEAAS